MLSLTRLLGGMGGRRLVREKISGKVPTGKIASGNIVSGPSPSSSSLFSSSFKRMKNAKGTSVRSSGRGGGGPKGTSHQDVRKNRQIGSGVRGSRLLLVKPPEPSLTSNHRRKTSTLKVSTETSLSSVETRTKGGQRQCLQGSSTSKVMRSHNASVGVEKRKKANKKGTGEFSKDHMERNEFESDDPSARPRYMTEEVEKKVLKKAERMRDRDLSGDYPVPSFVLELLKLHPSIRKMGLRERIDFLCSKWDLLSKAERKIYVRNPLKGLIPEADEL